jgi:hypothetical protein
MMAASESQTVTALRVPRPGSMATLLSASGHPMSSRHFSSSVKAHFVYSPLLVERCKADGTRSACYFGDAGRSTPIAWRMRASEVASWPRAR